MWPTLPSLELLSPWFCTVLNLVKFGERHLGMIVHAVGRGDGASILQSWHLLAEADDGVYIPTMTIEALIRKQLRCERPAPAAARCWQGRAEVRRGGGLPPLIPRC